MVVLVANPRAPIQRAPAGAGEGGPGGARKRHALVRVHLSLQGGASPSLCCCGLLTLAHRTIGPQAALPVWLRQGARLITGLAALLVYL